MTNSHTHLLYVMIYLLRQPTPTLSLSQVLHIFFFLVMKCLVYTLRYTFLLLNIIPMDKYWVYVNGTAFWILYTIKFVTSSAWILWGTFHRKRKVTSSGRAYHICHSRDAWSVNCSCPDSAAKDTIPHVDQKYKAQGCNLGVAGYLLFPFMKTSSHYVLMSLNHFYDTFPTQD